MACRGPIAARSVPLPLSREGPLLSRPILALPSHLPNADAEGCRYPDARVKIDSMGPSFVGRGLPTRLEDVLDLAVTSPQE